jgi:hypothetical protein
VLENSKINCKIEEEFLNQILLLDLIQIPITDDFKKKIKTISGLILSFDRCFKRVFFF